MKKIKLTQGKYALVDDEDYSELNKFKWCAAKTSKIYAFRSKVINGKRRQCSMHRELMQPKDGYQVDHIDGDGLNNQRSNLRVCTPSQNQMNKSKMPSNTSGYKGVFLLKTVNKWIAQISVGDKDIYLGIFADPLKAYEAYCKACIKYHGEFARLK